MFEEVPRERRGMARLVPVRRVVLGPFVLGGGMLLATLGGSVAVAAAAATMITASAIRSDDVPDRPGHPVPSTSTQQTLSAKRSPAQPRTAAAAAHSAVPRQSGEASPSEVEATGSASGSGSASRPGSVSGPGSAGVAPPAPARTLTASPPAGATSPTLAPSSPAASPTPTPAPSSSAPLGNAVIHVSGYDQASKRLAYQFASVQPGAGTDGGDLYEVLDSDTFTAALAPSITITSDGGICPPAGASCTLDQLIRAADSGFFAVVAIDARGELRSIIEVAGQSASPKLLPVPSTAPAAESSDGPYLGDGSPAPDASPSTTS